MSPEGKDIDTRQPVAYAAHSVDGIISTTGTEEPIDRELEIIMQMEPGTPNDRYTLSLWNSLPVE